MSSLFKTGLLTKFPHDFQDKQTTAEYQYSSKMQQIQIWFVILFFIKEEISCLANFGA